MSTLFTDQTGAQLFLTPQEVSELLRVSVHTIRRWIKEGDMPAYKVGRVWRIRKDDLNRWLDDQRPDPGDGDVR
jgi:PTS system nitrogen regulatory IIA component